MECRWPAQPSLSTPTASHLAAGFTRPEELLPALWLSLQHPATAEEFSVAVDLLDVTFTAQVWGKVALPITDPQASPMHGGLTGPYPTLRGCVFSSTLSKFSWCTGSHGGPKPFLFKFITLNKPLLRPGHATRFVCKWRTPTFDALSLFHQENINPQVSAIFWSKTNILPDSMSGRETDLACVAARTCQPPCRDAAASSRVGVASRWISRGLCVTNS